MESWQIALIIVVVIIAIFYSLSKTPVFKGKIGEFKVMIKIGKTKENEKYVLNDVLIDTENRSSQIDHIVINKNGVYVIETKNYSGRIYGEENQLNWTQVLNYGKVKNKFYSPIKQNSTHIYELKKIIGDDVPIKSVIVFVQGNTSHIRSDKVFKINEVKRVIKKQFCDETISIDEMKRVNEALINAKNESKTTNRQHIENIKVMNESIENNICPRCGKPLVEKKSKYGAFMACSGYPVCTFKKKK